MRRWVHTVCRCFRSLSRCPVSQAEQLGRGNVCDCIEIQYIQAQTCVQIKILMNAKVKSNNNILQEGILWWNKNSFKRHDEDLDVFLKIIKNNNNNNLVNFINQRLLKRNHARNISVSLFTRAQYHFIAKIPVPFSTTAFTNKIISMFKTED